MITAEFLTKFCAKGDTKYLMSTPGMFVDPETKREYSYGTDGRRIVITEGRIDGLEDRIKPNIAQFVTDPQGVEVELEALRTFLKCEPFGTCSECEGEGGMVQCECSRCGLPHEFECACDNGKVSVLNRGYIGPCPMNLSLFAGTLDGLTERTVRIHVTGEDKPVFVFCSDRRIVAMPMRNDGSFKDAARFEVAEGVA